MADMRGIKRDQERLLEARAEQDELIAKYQKSVRKMLGKPDFNTNSPKQVKQLLGVLGCSDIKSTQEKDLEKARFRHPLNARILELVINNRKARKLASTYLTVGDDAKEYKGRILFAFKPHGTDTGRLASSEHHFWCGIQGQNIPRGPIVKQTFVADPGFVLFEVDLEQAESRDTAYISGEPKLIDAVSGDNDFHSQNCANFFGVPYEKIYDNTERKTLDKELRDLAKRVNHGTNYGMGWYMLVDTMGLENIFKAKGLLQLSKFWGAKQVSVHLLDSYHKAYPGIANVYYKKMLMEVKTDNMLVSKAQHMIDDIPYWGGWTRYCFGDPDKSKHARNSYIAHVPQSLNAQTLNRGWVRVYRDIAMNPEYCDYIKLIAQVHDSIFGQVRIGHEHLVQRVADLMQIPVKIKSYDGNEYLFTVPADAGETAKYWSEL
jgi:DNA polymerase I-like protein with 3'-5' exonuclease and polymerase domains